jgi:hypothetical protein
MTEAACWQRPRSGIPVYLLALSRTDELENETGKVDDEVLLACVQAGGANPVTHLSGDKNAIRV